MKTILVLLALSGPAVASNDSEQVHSAAFPADIGLRQKDGLGYRVQKDAAPASAEPATVAQEQGKETPPPIKDPVSGSDRDGDLGGKSKPKPTTATAATGGTEDDPDVSLPAVAHAYRSLRAAGLRPGFDPKKELYVIVGQASIAAEPSQANFGIMRQAAFQAAMLDATRSHADFLGVEVATRIESHLRSPLETSIASAAAEERQARRLSALAFEQAENFIQNRHKSHESGAASASQPMSEEEAKEVVEEVLNSKEMKAAIQVAAAAEVASIQVWRAFEDSGNGREGSVAVVCISSKGSRAMVEAMLGMAAHQRAHPRWTSQVGSTL